MQHAQKYFEKLKEWNIEQLQSWGPTDKKNLGKTDWKRKHYWPKIIIPWHIWLDFLSMI